MKAATVTELATALGVNRGTVHEWLRAGLPRNPDGSFDVGTVERWRAERERVRGGKGDLAAWRTRRERANALRAERELAREGAKLILRAEHERMQVELVGAFVDALDSAPAKITSLLVAARGHSEIESILREHFRGLRIQLAAKYSPPPQPVDDAGDEVEP